MSAPSASGAPVPSVSPAVTEDEVLHEGETLGRLLASLGVMAVTAESCTGGLVARALTETAGSSVWFERGFVTYSNEAKQASLGVRADTLQAHGAVSEAVAAEMAAGALAHSLGGVSIAITGIAGPTGAVPGKPVGTVCFGWAIRTAQGVVGPVVGTATVLFSGDRASVRRQAAVHALREAARRVRQEGTDRPPTA